MGEIEPTFPFLPTTGSLTARLPVAKNTHASGAPRLGEIIS
jgi:hypothetical protein